MDQNVITQHSQDTRQTPKKRLIQGMEEELTSNQSGLDPTNTSDQEIHDGLVDGDILDANEETRLILLRSARQRRRPKGTTIHK